MDVSPIQVLLIFIVAFIAGIDQFSFLESLYQPIVTGFLVGLIRGCGHFLGPLGHIAQGPSVLVRTQPAQ